MDSFIMDTTGSIFDIPSAGTQKSLLVLFIVDATRTMDGQAIAQVNVAIQELTEELRNFATNNNIAWKLGICSFTNSIRWVQEPKNIAELFGIEKIVTRPGLTQYGGVYHELNKRLKKGDLIEEVGKQASPVLIFLTDGAPTDDYKSDLADLQKNPFYQAAMRAAVVMGEGAEDPKAKAAVGEFATNGLVLTTGTHMSIVSAIELATMHVVAGGPVPEPTPDPGPFPEPDQDQDPDPDPVYGTPDWVFPTGDPVFLSDPAPGDLPSTDPFSDMNGAADGSTDMSLPPDDQNTATRDPF